jgi:hypothetical protein
MAVESVIIIVVSEPLRKEDIPTQKSQPAAQLRSGHALRDEYPNPRVFDSWKICASSADFEQYRVRNNEMPNFGFRNANFSPSSGVPVFADSNDWNHWNIWNDWNKAPLAPLKTGKFPIAREPISNRICQGNMAFNIQLIDVSVTRNRKF